MTRPYRYLLPIVALLLLSYTTEAQVNAVTDNGESVILFQDGTWVYAEGEEPDEVVIEENKNKFSKDGKSSFLVKSTKCEVGLWLNAKTWKFKKGDSSEAAEFTFEMKNGELYGMMINERAHIPLLSLRQIAVDNARDAGANVKIVHEEYRTVNGVQVLSLHMTGVMQGVRFVYYGYYYSSERGTVQLVTYTTQNLFDEYHQEMDTFLNGFVEL